MQKSTPKMTPAEIEKRVLASLIDPNTSEQMKPIAEKDGLDEEMFTDANIRDLFTSWMRMGGVPFGGFIEGKPAAAFSTPEPAVFKTLVGHIVRAYRKRIRELDRTLDEFATPSKDKDDEDCLFKNRWLRRGACGFVISSAGVGKSSFTYQASVTWAVGVPMLGIPPIRPLKVGIVQSEDDEYDVANFRDRIRIGLRSELHWDNDKIAEAEQKVTFCAWDGSTGARFVEFLRRKQLIHHFDLIIVNPLHAFFGGDIKNADEVSKFLRNGIDRLIKDEDTKCGILFVHHTGKPSKESIATGDFFAGYMGSGSAELINYPRIALTLVPYKDGKIPGVFNLIGSKHGDKLDWKTADGKRTQSKVVCYANRLERHRTDGAIFWVEPDADDLEALTEAAKPSDASQLYKQIATALAEAFKREEITAPARWIREKKYTFRQYSIKQVTSAFNLIKCDPAAFGLKTVIGDKKTEYFIADETKKTEVQDVEF